MMWQLQPGDLLHQGRYRLREQLVLSESQSDQGAAWLASDTQTRTDRLVVIRELRFPTGPLSNTGPIWKPMLAQLTELGQHPALPDVLDTFEFGMHRYVVFQHIEGPNLATVLESHGGALPERTVAEYGRQLCEILTLFSRQRPPFIHGAISSRSVIVSADKQRIALIHPPLFPRTLSSAQQTGPLSGYGAPEQARGQVSPASDLYAVAAIMHHAVTGYNPRERLRYFYPPARRLNPRVTQQMEEILARELHLSVSQRYPRAADMQADLTSLLASSLPAKEEDPVPTPKVQLNLKQMRELSRSRTLLQTLTVGMISFLVLALIFGVLLYPLLTQNNASAQIVALKAEMAAEQHAFTSQGIGLSDGDFTFDTYSGRSDIALKQQAAYALLHNDLASAANYLSQAVSADPTDGEAQIYNENLHVLQSGSPSITIVLGIAFDSKSDDLLRARVDSQGAFLAQYEINEQNLLPHGLKLRLMIDSCGNNHSDVATVAQFVANRVLKAGNPDHIVGVAGWPFSSQTIIARDIIASAHLPLVSQGASSIKLSGSSPYFFRVNPPDNAQGDALGKVAVQQLHAKTILLLRDPTDPYSVSLADSFTASAQRLGAHVINNPADYFTAYTTPVSSYEKVVQDAQLQKADLLFISGFSIDGVRLAHALGNVLRANPSTDTTLSNLSILGGDGLATDLVTGQGAGPEAQIAATFPQDMRHLLFTAFADPNAWNMLGIPQSQQPTFLHDWASFYQSSGIAANNAPPPTNDGILTNDAIQVIAEAASLVKGNLNGDAVRGILAALGKGTYPAFQGVSGRIEFDAQGNPIDKAIVVLAVQADNSGHNQMKLIQVLGTFRLVP